MNTIEQMIQTLCPDGVKRVRLGDCCDFKRGSTITAKDAVEGDIPVIAGGQKPAYYHNIANRTGETITVAGSGAYAGFVAYWNQPIYVSDAFTVSPKNDGLMVKYVYYFLVNIQEKIHNTKKGSGVPHVHPSSIDNFSIPLPPLPIQEEIVKILDRFAVLTAELEARRKQYEYYRTLLLDFSEGKKQAYEGQSDPRTRLLSFDSVSSSDSVRWMRLGEVGIVTKLAGFEFSEYMRYSDIGDIIALRGLNVKNGGLILDDVKYVDNSDFSKLNRSKLFRNDILYTYVGTVGQVGLVDENDKYYLAPNVALIRIKEQNRLLPKFVVYYLLSKPFQSNQLTKLMASSSMKNITMEKIRTFLIPIPPLSEQERIVNILDKFDQLVNGVKDSIPALIDDVQKQYEFYRNKLLTFPE